MSEPLELRDATEAETARWRERASARWARERAVVTGLPLSTSAPHAATEAQRVADASVAGSGVEILAVEGTDAVVVLTRDAERWVVSDLDSGDRALDGRVGDLASALVDRSRARGDRSIAARRPGPHGEGPLRDLSPDWTLVATRMLLRLGDEPAADVELVEMDADEFAQFRERLVLEYAESRAKAGASSPESALEESRIQTDGLLPQGQRTPQHSLLTVRSGGERVGVLWLFERRDDEGAHGFVYDVEVDEAARGRGLGRAAMRAVAARLAQRGCGFVELNVFGHNSRARTLYESLGYVVTDEMRILELDPGD